jgi:hypothetical protein
MSSTLAPKEKYMQKIPVNNINECKDCKRLIGAGKYTKPHKNLRLQDSLKFSSITGAADEANYKCIVCEKKWLHETGSCGMGWL